MRVEIIRSAKIIPSKFFTWAKTDLTCPECRTKGMVIKYRCNGNINFSHGSSGIILACENWNSDCQSKWNPIGNGREFPWHTWLSSFHRMLDMDRGLHGTIFLQKLKEEYPLLYDKILMIDNEINVGCTNESY
jgi:hypothetical protein